MRSRLAISQIAEIQNRRSTEITKPKNQKQKKKQNKVEPIAEQQMKLTCKFKIAMDY